MEERTVGEPSRRGEDGRGAPSRRERMVGEHPHLGETVGEPPYRGGGRGSTMRERTVGGTLRKRMVRGSTLEEGTVRGAPSVGERTVRGALWG